MSRTFNLPLSPAGSATTRRRDLARARVAVLMLGGVDAFEALLRRAGRGAWNGESQTTVEGRVRANRSDRARRRSADGHARSASTVITIRRTLDDVHALFADVANYPRFMPRFMAHLDHVEVLGEDRCRWRIRTIAGRTVEIETELSSEPASEGERLLIWRSLPGAEVDLRAVLRLRPSPEGTELHLDLDYRAPGRGLGVLIAKLFGFEPGQQARGDLRRLKQVLEAGEVVHSDASIHRLFHAAQPPSDAFVRRHQHESAAAAHPEAA